MIDASAVRLGRLGPLLLLGQLAWAAPGAASGTLLAALLAGVTPRTRSASSPPTPWPAR